MSLTEDQKQQFNLFREQFEIRFFPSPVDKLKSIQDMWSTKQKPGQSVDEFVEFMMQQQKLCQNLMDDVLRQAEIERLEHEEGSRGEDRRPDSEERMGRLEEDVERLCKKNGANNHHRSSTEKET